MQQPRAAPTEILSRLWARTTHPAYKTSQREVPVPPRTGASRAPTAPAPRATAAPSAAELIATMIFPQQTSRQDLAAAKRLLHAHPSIHRIAALTPEAFESITGWPAPALRILQAAAQLCHSPPPVAQPRAGDVRLTTHAAVIRHLAPHFENAIQERLVVVATDREHNHLSTEMVYQGTVNSAQVRTPEILRVPISVNAERFVIAHNHPAGNPAPSQKDLDLTRSIEEAARSMDLVMTEHYVLGSQGRYVTIIDN